MTRRASPELWWGGLVGLGIAAPFWALACGVTFGDLPATCDSKAGKDACPSGYECINAVCARAGTKIPITIQSLQNLRSVDLRIVPQTSGVLVLWQIYHYDTEHHDFAAARLSPDGTLSAPMIVVSQYPASSNYLEPYFDVLPISDSELLMTIGAAPFDDRAEPRLTQFAVHLPPVGEEAKGASTDQVWEKRMPTVGYGAVSEPRLVRSSSGISLGYFESLTDQTKSMKKETVGELAVFDLASDGTQINPPACADSSCCQANECSVTRGDLPIAVSVVDGFTSSDSNGQNIWWILDDTRPSFVAETSSSDFVAADLPRLSVPLQATADTLLVLQPSPRTGRGLPDDQASGPATLFSVSFDAAMNVGAAIAIGSLPGVRDTPGPVWVPRDQKPALLVTPGTEVSAADIEVLSVDPASAQSSEVAKIHRYSSLPIGAVRAELVQGKLFVVWLDQSEDTAIIRGAILDEP